MLFTYYRVYMYYRIVVLNNQLKGAPLVVQENVKLSHRAHDSLHKMFSINLLRAMRIPIHSSRDLSHIRKVRLTIVRSTAKHEIH